MIETDRRVHLRGDRVERACEPATTRTFRSGHAAQYRQRSISPCGCAGLYPLPHTAHPSLRTDHPAFAAIQLAAMRGYYPLGTNLHASPDAPMTRVEAAVALAGFFGQNLERDKAIAYVIAKESL